MLYLLQVLLSCASIIVGGVAGAESRKAQDERIKEAVKEEYNKRSSH